MQRYSKICQNFTAIATYTLLLLSFLSPMSNATNPSPKHTLTPNQIDQASLYLNTDQNKTTKVVAEKIISKDNGANIFNFQIEMRAKNHCILSAKGPFGVIDYKDEMIFLKGPVNLAFTLNSKTDFNGDENCNNHSMMLGKDSYHGTMQQTQFNYKTGILSSTEPVEFQANGILLNSNNFKLNTLTNDAEFGRGVTIQLLHKKN